jgi:hypothetical protein
MKTLNEYLQKHTLITALLATALVGCDGQEAKAPEEAVVTPKVVESKPVTPPVAPATPAPAPAPVAQPPANPTPQPVSQAPVTPRPKPAVVLSSDKSGLVNIAKGKVATQSADYTPAYNGSLAVDGNVDGDFKHASVAHTAQNPNAWLDVDLGNNEKIDHIVVWNRTDGALNRLFNYWIFISDKPFSPTDTVEKLRKIKTITAIKGGAANPSFTTPSAVTKGRYVRIQLDGSAAPSNAFLHIAEVEVYRAK